MIERTLPAGRDMRARVRCSERHDGDFRCDGPGNGRGSLDGGAGTASGRSVGQALSGRALVAPADGGVGTASGRSVGQAGPDTGGAPVSGGGVPADGGRGWAERGASRPSDAGVESRRQALMGGRWTWLRQQHGADVVVVTEPGAGAGAAADGAVTTVPGAVLAVHVADCAPVVVAGGGAVGVAHAGWRGVAAGIVAAVAEAVRAAAPGRDPVLRALLCPMIRPDRYEFGAGDLALVSAAAGCDVSALTAWGAPALDLAAAVRATLEAAGVSLVEDWGLDTAQERFFSHRVRADAGRQALTVRLEPEQ